MTDEEFVKLYHVEPTMLENLKASQKSLEKLLGEKLTLEDVYAIEIDQTSSEEEADEE